MNLVKKPTDSLSAYFQSGWAFLIPYLAAYLLYAWLKWPVNELGVGSTEHGVWTWVPSLLHLYWFLHAVHLVLAGIVLVTWWRTSDLSAAGPKMAWQRLYGMLPWLLLALLFWIPGAYLELPADPWAHYIRINEWMSVQQVTQHSAWLKFSYFLSYTLIGGAADLQAQLVRLDVYYTGCCLLLCWQYYRLGRAVGLDQGSALIFVLLQSVVFGNSIFSFYRYYGISSSLFAQLGAVALTRIALEAMRGKLVTGNRRLGEPGSDTPISNEASAYAWFSRLPPPASRLLQGASALALVALIAFNHVQALGIGGLGIAAVVVWRLILWRRSMIGWLALAAVGLSAATILWFPRNPVLDEIYRPQGWLTAWYGFNLFAPSSPAFGRTLAILGWVGGLNLLVGAVLMRRNHLVGWITLVPVVSLSLPFVAIPLANALSEHNGDPDNIITFHRMFFAVPAGLALVVLGSMFFEHVRVKGLPAWAGKSLSLPSVGTPNPAASFFLLGALFFLVLAPAPAPSFNRFYHVLVKTPDDLDIKPPVREIEAVASLLPPLQTESVSLAIGEAVYARRTGALGIGTRKQFRITSYIAAAHPVTDILVFLRHFPHTVFVPQNGRELYTSASLAGYLSGHWPPQVVAIGARGGPEFERNAASLGYQELGLGGPRAYIQLPAKAGPAQPVAGPVPGR